MKRFCHEKSHPLRRPSLILVLFILAFSAFTFGINKISEETEQTQKESLTQAISRGVAHCYATNGYYPESLDYLKIHYGITYDSEKFFIDYQILGENSFPDITIIEKTINK